MKNYAQLKLTGSSIIIILQGLKIIKAGEVKYGRVRVSTGYQIAREYWQEDIGRPTHQYSLRDRFHLHQELDRLEQLMNKAYASFQQPTPELVKEKFYELTGKKKAQTPSTAITIAELFFGLGEKHHHPRTAGHYRTFARRVEQYESETGKRTYLDGFSPSDYEELFQWAKHSLNLGTAAQWNFQKMLNKALAEGSELNLNVTAKPKHKVKHVTEKKDWLDWSDYATILNHPPENERLKEIWVILNVMMWTSIRISDIWRFFQNIQQINGYNVSSFRCTKSPSPEVLPLIVDPLWQILQENTIPKERSEVDIRRGIKKLMQTYCINKNISPHSLRRSWITNLLCLGTVPEYLIAKVYTGHSLGGRVNRVFQSYNKATLLQQVGIIHNLLKQAPKEQTSNIKLLK